MFGIYLSLVFKFLFTCAYILIIFLCYGGISNSESTYEMLEVGIAKDLHLKSCKIHI